MYFGNLLLFAQLVTSILHLKSHLKTSISYYTSITWQVTKNKYTIIQVKFVDTKFWKIHCVIQSFLGDIFHTRQIIWNNIIRIVLCPDVVVTVNPIHCRIIIYTVFEMNDGCVCVSPYLSLDIYFQPLSIHQHCIYDLIPSRLSQLNAQYSTARNLASYSTYKSSQH